MQVGFADRNNSSDHWEYAYPQRLRDSLPSFSARALPVGNFSASRDITSSDGVRRELVQDVMPAFVLDSEAAKRSDMLTAEEVAMPIVMNDASGNPEAEKTATVDSDEQLMVGFSGGSAEAFTELFSRYKQPLFGFFHRRVADPAQAEELTQETFLAVLRASLRYEPRALFRTYLYAVGFRILRAHRRNVAFRATFLGAAGAYREPATRNTADAELFLRHAMAKLERTEREVLMLREFEQLSYAEIAEVLGLPLNTVRSRLFRARGALRDLLVAPAPGVSATKLAESEERV
jgi:RNA polymerase sigma-70 factor (ECF subfamily)